MTPVKDENSVTNTKTLSLNAPDDILTTVDKNWAKEPFESKLTIEQMEKLQAAGVEPVALDSNMALSLPEKIDKASMTLLANSGLPVALAHNSNTEIEDDWIAGTIDPETIQETEGKLSYQIDCAGFSGSTRKFKYDVKQNKAGGNEWTISYSSGYKSENGNLYTKPNIAYKIQSKHMETSTDPVISKTNRNGYTKLSA